MNPLGICFCSLHFSLCFFYALLFNQNIFRFHCYALHMNMHIERNKAWNMECCSLFAVGFGLRKIVHSKRFLLKTNEKREKKGNKELLFNGKKWLLFVLLWKMYCSRKKCLNIILSFEFSDWIPYKFGSNALMFNRFFFSYAYGCSHIETDLVRWTYKMKIECHKETLGYSFGTVSIFFFHCRFSNVFHFFFE